MRACLVFSLLLSSACATVLRGSNRDLTIYGPQGLQAFDGDQPIPLHAVYEDPAETTYVASVDRHLQQVTLRSPSRTAQATLETHVSAGWLVADFVLLGIIGIGVDYYTGAWLNYKDVTFAANGPMVTTSSLGPERAPPAPPGYPPPPPPPPGSQQQPPPRQQAPPQIAAAGRPLLDRGKLAVLDFANSAKEVSKDDVRYFADVVRGATLRAAPQMDVMTRENLLVLLQTSGRSAVQCDGQCEVDTGRRAGADAVISGEVLKVGTQYKISLKLHETREGRLLSTAVASGQSIDELDEKLQAATAELLAPR
jgi:hypothetical protein